ncbi:MAG: efflux RND transporter periplasmic adaptor subunit [Patescibacteria group bacterium]|nr:efflux RND transporter periplasmic adaptor subunit [Patescibacteria group bacterium]
MKKRTIIIITIVVLAIGSYVAYGFMKEPELKYTTAKVTNGEILQTVSATGAVEAETKLDLHFMNSERIREINVSVGDSVKKDEVLAKLDIIQLTSQLNKAKAGLSAAQANLSKLLEGATIEDIRVSETAVANSQVALDNAKQNLVNTEASAVKDIANAEASVNSAQTSLDSANQSLINTQIANENNLDQDYDNAWDIINSSLLTADNSLDANDTVLDNDDAQDTLSVLNIQYLNNSSQSKAVAENSYNNAKDYINSINSNLSDENIDEALVQLKSALEDIRITLSDTSDVLGATITSSKLTQAELDALKSSISTTRTNTNIAISNATTAQQNISTQKVTNQTSLDSAQAAINSYQSALNLSEQSLNAVKASSDTRINSSENSVKSAEGALKQAQDQLALKTAKPSYSNVLLYRARVQEAQASVDLTESQISDSILVAPQNGIVTEINGEVGESITSAVNFISIIASENFEIKTNISEVDIAKVKIDDKVEITFDALGPNKKFTGSITEIDPAQTEISGVIYYKTATIFTGNLEIIKPGMTANLDIITAKKDNAVMIPFQALKEKNNQKYVQVSENKILRDVFVEVGLRGDVNIEILNGLKGGEDVVTFIEE